jgi:hypothetical protein
MAINIQEVKDKIILYISEKGPSLPIPIARALNMQTMLVSAVLSELISEKKIIISHLRVGNSPLYFMPGQEARLEIFSEHLGAVEREAFKLLKDERILIDDELEPAFRVALRHIKDFAFSFKIEEKIIWRYYLVSEHDARDIFRANKIPASKIISDVSNHVVAKPEPAHIGDMKDVSDSIWKDIEKQQYKENIREKITQMANEIAEKQKELESVRQQILDKVTTPSDKKIIELPQTEIIEKKGKKKDPKQEFLTEVKDFISKKNFELISIEGLSKSEILAKVRDNAEPGKIFLVIAINKKKISESDLLRAYKKATKLKLEHFVAFKGELSKKVKEKIDAFKHLINTGIMGA